MSPVLMRYLHTKPSSKAAQLILLVVAVSLLLSCTTTSPNTEKSRSVAAVVEEAVVLTSDGLKMVRSTPRSKLWIRPDHHIGRYDDIIITGIDFAYGQGQTHLDEGQESEVGEMLVNAIGGITKNSPVGKATTIGPCVVALQLGLKDIQLHLGETSGGSSISYVRSFGSATMIVEFRDSTTDTTLLRYAANRGLGSGQGTGRVGANMGKLGRALGEMVTDMTTELQMIVPATTNRPKSECNDGIYELTGRG